MPLTPLLYRYLTAYAYGQPDCKISTFFYAFPIREIEYILIPNKSRFANVDRVL